MPRLEKNSICIICRRSFVGTGDYCPDHKPIKIDNRQSASMRGYDHGWRKIRIEVLKKAGIPRTMWHLYDVDHNPPYDPDIEPNHRKYHLIPRLHTEHSRKTAENDIKRDEKGLFLPKKDLKGYGGV